MTSSSLCCSPSPTVSAADATAREGSPADPAEFTVLRTGDTSADLVVNYNLIGTASNALDYYTLTGSVRRPPGEDSATLRIEPIADRLYEGDENVLLMLDEGGYIVGFPYVAAAVIEDEALSGVCIVATDTTAVEGAAGDTAVFTVPRLGATAAAVHAGVEVPGITDGYAGSSPDLGAAGIPWRIAKRPCVFLSSGEGLRWKEPRTTVIGWLEICEFHSSSVETSSTQM